MGIIDTHPETIFLDSYGRLSVGLYNYEKKLYERVAISQNDLDNLFEHRWNISL